VTPVEEGPGPGPRCRARMAYLHSEHPGLAAPPRVEHRSARCHLEHGHEGPHHATVPSPEGGRGRIHAFRIGSRA